MNSEIGNYSDKKKKLSQIFEQLMHEGKLQGILLAYRDGKPIFNSFNEDIGEVNSSELSSMCASVLQGANNLSKLIGDVNLTKIVAELNSYMLIIIQGDRNVFITLIADANSHVNEILVKMKKIIKKIIFLY